MSRSGLFIRCQSASASKAWLRRIERLSIIRLDASLVYSPRTIAVGRLYGIRVDVALILLWQQLRHAAHFTRP